MGGSGGNGGTIPAGGSGGNGGSAASGGSGGGSSVGTGNCTSIPDEGAGWGTTYYVRTDGGNATECNGLADAPYPGSGTGHACAWEHPFIALPPAGTAQIAGGDKLIIGPGSYRIGYGAPGTGSCWASGSYECYLATIPSGPDAAHPTRIYGAGWDQGCPSAPELWGAERVWQILDLSDADHVRVGCLEITDHSDCVEFHSGNIECERDNSPYGDWGGIGIYAEDSSDVTLCNVNIHGMAHAGVQAGRLADWTVEHVRIAANGWVGWDGDIYGSDSNSGTMHFIDWTVEYNGCGETYPGQQPTDCWSQTAGGYGDGVGTGATGADWIIEDSVFRANTSDGLDLLYHDGGGSITIDRVWAGGNAGQQIKTRGPTTIRNSVIVGNCAYFDGQPFTYNVDNCRALGSAVALFAEQGNTFTVVNNTMYSQGDCLMVMEGFGCNGTESLVSRNNIFIGDDDFLQPGDLSCFMWTGNCPGISFDHDYNIITGVKNNPCPIGSNDICTDPLLVDPTPVSFDPALQSGSQARNTGLSVGGIVPTVDFFGNTRPNGGGVDRGAVEM